MIEIDLEKGIVRRNQKEYPIGSEEAFGIISEVWLRSGWDAKYVYSFAWMGRPIIQLPEDMIRIQEVIYSVKPDVIIETGVAHGGSLIFYAGLCKAMEKGKVIGIDIEIRSHNRKAIEEHLLSPFITLIEGSSIEEKIVNEVKRHIKPTDKVLVLLDSNHTYEHVLNELRMYAPMVSVGSYIVATDGIMENLVGAPRSNPDWATNNPKKAAEAFVLENTNFIITEPAFPFNEGSIKNRVTYWPGSFVKRIK
ncbi:MAG: cephalosporin hydroxylase family protein [Flavobacteriales bacterium]